MIHTKSSWPIPVALPRLAGEAGDTLIEVLISAIVIVLVVTATLTGLNNANRATSIDRARSQADALAQQDEEELRGEPVAKLSELSRTHETILHEVTTGGTHFSITSTARYISDATATASCTSTTPTASYIQTSSTVSWHSNNAKPVVETGIISPPAGSALIVQVSGASGEPVAHAVVESFGPSNIDTETSSDGCAILAVTPGEYTLNVHRAGYVDPNGYENSREDPISNHSFYVVAEASAKRSYSLAPAGWLSVKYSSGSPGVPSEGDTFVIFNTGLTAFRKFGTAGVYNSTVTSSKTVFPFTSKYIVYAGTCESDQPTANDSALASNPEVEVLPASSSPNEVTVPLPPVSVKVMTGNSSVSGSTVSGAIVFIKDEGCGTERTLTTSAGALSHEGRPVEGLPFGHYSMCVSYEGRLWKGSFANNTLTGPSTTWTNGGTSGNTATIYLGTNPTSPVPAGTEAGACP